MDDLILLINAANEYELAAISGILNDNGIPFVKRDIGLGAYMRIYAGRTIEGIKIYVNEESFEKARELIGNFLIDSDDDIAAEAEVRED